ncbi:MULTISPECIES: LLM class flavin-dependent oxidoreductase [unclassified Nocardioides]|uniref:LLM class flavin-dependent oxidoreductase n=1 Tax=unclassified Nocardioides TaxID=2615069 RepID=UPI003015841E
MNVPRVPLGVLDLVPISSGSTPGEAIRRSLDLARQAERLGYARYWFAEHHLNPGVAGTSPAVLLAMAAEATSTIRLGSGAVLLGHRTALSTVEEFGLLDALHPGRFDLGLGRSSRPSSTVFPAPPPEAVTPVVDGRAPNGLRVPGKFSPAGLLDSPRFALQRALLQQPGAESQDYTEQVGDILALLAGSYRDAAGTEAHVVPGEGADLEVWILGSSGGESAHVAGQRSLPFAANYHVSPGAVLEAADGYRAAFRPSEQRPRPHLAVSADVVVAETAAEAVELATGYRHWVRSIRSGEGAIAFPTPDEARALPWPDHADELVGDRLETQVVGDPSYVVARLEQLHEATGADELVITTVTHRHEDRVRSYELLARAWSATD